MGRWLDATRETILRAGQTLSDELGKQGVPGEVCLFGGTVMAIAITRPAGDETPGCSMPTNSGHTELARRIAADLPADWLNAGGEGSISARPMNAGRLLE